MTWTDALEIVVGRTGHERFRSLCADGNRNRKQREAYRQLVIQMARCEPDEFHATPPDPETQRLDSLMRGCPARTPKCACGTAVCAKLGREVVVFECHQCLKGLS